MKIGLEYRIDDETALKVVSSSTTPHRNEATEGSVKVWLRPGDSFEVYRKSKEVKIEYNGDEKFVKVKVGEKNKCYACNGKGVTEESDDSIDGGWGGRGSSRTVRCWSCNGLGHTFYSVG